MIGFESIATFLIIVVILIISGIKILKEYERAVIFRLGRLVQARGPGVTYVVPFVERMIRVELRTAVSVEGDAAEKIIELARERLQSLVAMCTHGRMGAGRWVLGSVTDRVVHHSGHPIMVIPPVAVGKTFR